MNEPHLIATDRSHSRGAGMRLQVRPADLFGGAVAGLLTITYGLSYAVLIFSGPLLPWLGYGLAASFVSSAALALVVALGSSFRFAVAGVDSSTAAVAAILSASLTERLIAEHPGMSLLEPVLLTLSAATLLTGVLLCALGMSRVGRAIRYVPYPVIGGFLGATGFLIVLGAVKVITGHAVTLQAIAGYSEASIAQIAAGGAVAGAITLALRRTKSAFVLPTVLLCSLILAQIGFGFAGISAAEAQRLGWTFATPAPSSLLLPWHFATIAQYPWDTLPELLGNVIAVIFVTAIGTLFNTTGIEVETHREADLDRELTAGGLANMLSGALGGYSGCVSISRSLLNYRSGGRGRISGLTTAAMAALMLVLDPAFLGHVPKFVLGGLLLQLGFGQLKRWIVDSRHRLSVTDYVSLIAIVVIIVQWGFIAGVLIGTIIGCMTFALSASRINSIKFGFNATEYRSSLDRAGVDVALLNAHGGEIQGLNLQSYLFFGSANRLYQHVKVLLQRYPECRHLVFDFTLVNGVDSSAAYSFAQIKRLSQERGARLVLVNLPPPLAKILRASQFISGDVVVMPELDHALEWCENELIARHGKHEGDEGTLIGWLAGVLGSDVLAEELTRRCRRVKVAAGEVIARVGEAADCMHFIVEGRVNIIVPTDLGRVMRVRSLGRFTTIGEMGMVSGQPRSATIEADIDSTLYVLPAAAFDAIKTENPKLGQALLVYFMSVMAERLTFANRTIGVLRR
ncbi:SulP family inorganic anion transporter [Rhodopseudomonas sp.]|uniref:SLC26A/SulP transporter family protein n=1 Tax=Rhodopseudomonas sp. TaxID=1078 RepID=UPI0025D30FF7|nr:SulP family inorganic anion transporter [Rhodopseudomonas sp.]